MIHIGRRVLLAVLMMAAPGIAACGGGTSDPSSAGDQADVSTTPGSDGSDAVTRGNAIGKGASISRYLVGQNFWYHIGGIRANWPLVEESGVSVVRIGGIEFNNTPPRNTDYLTQVREIKAIGAEPIVQVSRHLTDGQAGELVRFLNVTHRQNVRFWSIGNEPEQEQGRLNAELVASYVRRLATAMKAADPSIQIFAPDVAWYNEAYLGPLIGGAHDITGKDANGRYFIDGVTFHTYPNPIWNADGTKTFDRGTVVTSAGRVRDNVRRLRTLLRAANAKHGRTGDARLQWALTEFNVTYENPDRNGVEDYGATSFLNGQFFAEVFGIGMQYGAKFVAPWSVLEDGSRGRHDLGYLDTRDGTTKPRSSYWHLQLVANHFRGKYAAGRTNRPLVTAYGAGDGSKLAVMIVNKEEAQNYPFTVHLHADAAPSGAPLDIHIDSKLTGEVSGNIDAQATAVLLFNARGELTKRIDYSINDAMAWRPPH